MIRTFLAAVYDGDTRLAERLLLLLLARAAAAGFGAALLAGTILHLGGAL